MFRHKRPLRATEPMPRRSRGAIGRVRATPGALPTAGRSTDGPEGRANAIPGVGKGLKPYGARFFAFYCEHEFNGLSADRGHVTVM